MLKHNTYFDGNVQSIGFERHGKRATAGVIAKGEYHFDTDGAERMIVVSGELLIRIKGEADFRHYPQGTSFEVPAKSGFDIRASTAAAYICEFL